MLQVGLLHAHGLAWAERLLTLRAAQHGLGRGGCRALRSHLPWAGMRSAQGSASGVMACWYTKAGRLPAAGQISTRPHTVPQGLREEGHEGEPGWHPYRNTAPRWRPAGAPLWPRTR